MAVGAGDVVERQRTLRILSTLTTLMTARIALPGNSIGYVRRGRAVEVALGVQRAATATRSGSWRKLWALWSRMAVFSSSVR